MSQLISLGELIPGVERLGRTWHPRLALSFGRYLSMRRGRLRRPKTLRVIGEPYWLLVPQWLMQRFGRGERSDRRFLLDALHGQVCAFLAIKLQDDLFDEHVSDRSLIFAAGHLWHSAHEAFVPHSPAESAFWPFLDSSLRRTITAIIDWDYSQLHGFGPASSVKAMTGAGYAVCNLATFAVCLRLKKRRLLQAILPCTDQLAFVGQLLDDLDDMQSDFDRGRLNYAARFLLRRPVKSSADFARGLAAGILLDGRLRTFLEMLQKHLRRAADIAASVGLPGLLEYIKHHEHVLELLNMQLHRKRVEVTFGNVASQ